MHARIVAGSLLIAWAAACASSDAGAGAEKTPFTIWVLERSPGSDDTSKPLARVPVTFLSSGGERITRSTESDGHVTFEGDFRSGGAAVTVLSADHVYVTMLQTSPDAARARPNAVGKPASDLVVFPPPLDQLSESRTVGLNGRIFGKRNSNDVVTVAVSSLPRLGRVVALEATYALRVPKERPVFLLGHETKTLVDDAGVVIENELLKSFRIDLPARAVEASLDLDLAKLPGLTTRLIHVKAEPPASLFPPGTRAAASTGSAVSGLATGIFARYRPATDGTSFDIDVTLADADVGGEPIVSRALLTAPDGSQSVRTEAGTQADGTIWSGFAPVPTIRDPDANRSVREPIVLDQFPPGADFVARIYAGSDQLFWILYGPPGGLRDNTFTIPYGGEVASADIQLFALSLVAQSERIPLGAGAEQYRYSSTSRDIILRKQ